MISSAAGPMELVSPGREQEYLDIGWKQYKVDILTLALKIYRTGWMPNQIICVGRGGNPLGDALSRLFKQTMGVIMCTSYSGDGPTQQTQLKIADHISITQTELKGKLLLVDDLVDSGKTLSDLSALIKERHPQVTEIKTAVIYQKTSTKFQPTFHGKITKEDVWIFLPNEVFERIPLLELEPKNLRQYNEQKLRELAQDLFDCLPQNPLEKFDINLLEDYKK